jgi:hypothetical protein
VTPPIGTLPPTGITPSLPGGVAPPIGTLPPTGITPSLPGGVAPPIATLPPTGITPSLPGGVAPPIATLPPSPPPGGVMPERPPRPPAAGQPGHVAEVPSDIRRARRQAEPPGTSCVDRQEQRARRERGESVPPLCPERPLVVSYPTPGDLGTGVPLTPGRDFDVPLTPGRDLGVQSLWNAWTQVNFIGTSDRRYGLDLKGRTGSVSLGVDRRLNDDVVVGVSISASDSRTDGFDDSLQSKATGFSVGPYVAVRLSRHWAMDATFSYGQVKNEVHLAILSGSYSSQVYSGSTTLHGQFDYGGYYFRPKLALYYLNVSNPAYDMVGSILGVPISVNFPATRFGAGALEFTNEVSRIFSLSSDAIAVPFVEAGVHYVFKRPNGGVMLAGDLTEVIPSAWYGGVRSGLRMAFKNAVLVEVGAGYLSIGQNDLDIWEARFRLSYGF